MRLVLTMGVIVIITAAFSSLSSVAWTGPNLVHKRVKMRDPANEADDKTA